MRINELTIVLAESAVIGVLIGVSRNIIHSRHGGLMGFFRGLLASVVMAVFVGLAINDMTGSPAVHYALIGISAYLSDDLLLALLQSVKIFAKDPTEFVTKIVRALRGK